MFESLANEEGGGEAATGERKCMLQKFPTSLPLASRKKYLATSCRLLLLLASLSSNLRSRGSLQCCNDPYIYIDAVKQVENVASELLSRSLTHLAACCCSVKLTC